MIFGANLVQHFMRRYSRYSRYRTKTHDKSTISHDKSTISHDISRYSRYQIVFLKLQEISYFLSYTQGSLFGGGFVVFVGETCGLPRANAVRPYGQGRLNLQKPRRPIYFSPFLWYNTTNR